MGRGLRIIQITEKDKHELSELGREALESMHEFLECLDHVTGGQISEEMEDHYGERRGVAGTGRYGRRMEERRGVAGTGRYGRRYTPEHYGEHYTEDGGREHYGERDYGNRYDY